MLVLSKPPRFGSCPACRDCSPGTLVSVFAVFHRTSEGTTVVFLCPLTGFGGSNVLRHLRARKKVAFC